MGYPFDVAVYVRNCAPSEMFVHLKDEQPQQYKYELHKMASIAIGKETAAHSHHADEQNAPDKSEPESQCVEKQDQDKCLKKFEE